MNTAAHSLDTRAGVQPLRILAWAVGPAAVALIHWLALDTHAVVRMCAMIAALFLWMKVVVIAETRAAGKPMLPHGRLAAWTALWPGMRPAAVARTPSSVGSTRGSGGTSPKRMDGGVHATHAWRGYLDDGLRNVLAGFGLIWLGYSVAGANWHLPFGWQFSVFGIPLIMVGFSLILHYGLFSIVTGFWRYAGFNVGPLFRNPFAARGLNDFWTRRWNLAYVEMCQETVLRVARSRAPGTKRLAVFVFSGLLHEVAISLPVMRGFGLPTLYFVLNGAAMHLERKWFREGGVAARVWAFVWIVLPLPLLFHPWFLQGIVVPIVGMRA